MHSFSDPEVRAKTKEVTAEARAKGHEISSDVKHQAQHVYSDAKSEAQKLYGDAKNLAHTGSGEAKGAYYDAKSGAQDILAKGENKAGASYLEQAEQKGKSLWNSGKAEVERMKGSGTGDASELKEVCGIVSAALGHKTLTIRFFV